MRLIAEVFPKLQTPKSMVTSMFKKSRFKDPPASNMVNGPNIVEICMAAPLPYLLITLKACKKSLLVISKISRLFPNTLSADGNYSLLNRDNLTQPI